MIHLINTQKMSLQMYVITFYMLDFQTKIRFLMYPDNLIIFHPAHQDSHISLVFHHLIVIAFE